MYPSVSFVPLLVVGLSTVLSKSLSSTYCELPIILKLFILDHQVPLTMSPGLCHFFLLFPHVIQFEEGSFEWITV